MGLRSIWQNQLAYHFTELTIRINQQDVLGETTRLRIKEGQLQGKYLSSLISKNYELNKVAFNNNIAMKVIQEAVKLDIEIKELEENPNVFDLKRTAITSLLSNKKSFYFINSNKMNLITLK